MRVIGDKNGDGETGQYERTVYGGQRHGPDLPTARHKKRSIVREPVTVFTAGPVSDVFLPPNGPNSLQNRHSPRSIYSCYHNNTRLKNKIKIA